MKIAVEAGQICLFDLPINIEPEEDPEITNEDIQRVLMFEYGLGCIEDRIKIYKNFISNNNHCSEEFLKEVFGTSGIINGKDSKGNMYSDRYGEYGISIYKGERKLFMPWAYVNTEISLLIRDNIYLSDEEKEKYGLIKRTI